MPRAFFALWPPAPVREEIAALRTDRWWVKGRPVPLGNLHLTLVFLGPVEPAKFEALAALEPDFAGPPITLALTELGWWRRPRIAWLAPDETPASLHALVRGLRAVAGQHGLQCEEREYWPHVTVARKVDTAPRCRAPFRVVWRAAEFVLVESITDPAGARYVVRRAWPLAAAQRR